jgi:hypothetical protein
MADDEEEEPDVLATATSLHVLALRYWADGRRTDAIRIERQAEALLRTHRMSGPLLTEVTRTIDELQAPPAGSNPA